MPQRTGPAVTRVFGYIGTRIAGRLLGLDCPTRIPTDFHRRENEFGAPACTRGASIVKQA